MADNAFDIDAAYGALRPHQRALFDLIGAGAVGVKKIGDSAVNAFDTMSRILGNGAPVTMDEVKQGAGDAAGVAMAGSMPFARPGSSVGSGGLRRLDMSEPARLERARKLGFDTDTTWYHGTTHDFNAFDPKKANPEGHLGRSIYLTNESADAAANYAGSHGPDITNRIEQRAEQIAQEMNAGWRTPEYEIARQRAASEVLGPHDGAILPLYARGNRIADLTPYGSPPWLDLTPRRGGDVHSPKMQAIERALMQAERDGVYDLKTTQVIDDLLERAYDGGPMSGRDLDRTLRGSEGMMYATDDTGQLVSSDLIRRIWQALGFRGVKIDATEKFQNMKMPSGTEHLMMFDPRDVRSVNAAFQPSKKNSSDLLAARGGLPITYGYQPPAPGEVY